MKKTQKQIVLAYLKRGGKITALKAFLMGAGMRLSAHILSLKKDGVMIKSETKTVKGKTFSEYSLIK